jgi:hypothetical protein
LTKEIKVKDDCNKIERSSIATVPNDGNASGRPPVQWWRFMSAASLDEVALRKMRASLSKIDVLGEPRWKDAASGDASASIRIALGMLPADAATLRCDLAMTALAVCAAEGNPAACLVMSHLLRQLPGAGNAEARIATSWLMRAFGKVLRRRARRTGTEPSGAKR